MATIKTITEIREKHISQHTDHIIAAIEKAERYGITNPQKVEKLKKREIEAAKGKMYDAVNSLYEIDAECLLFFYLEANLGNSNAIAEGKIPQHIYDAFVELESIMVPLREEALQIAEAAEANI